MGKSSKVYSFRDYDKYMSLKLNLETWLIVVYFLRPYILKFSTIRLGKGAGPRAGMDGFKLLVYPDDFSLALGVIASIPVFLFLFVWIKRKPGAAEFVIKLWHKSVVILYSAAALNIAIIFVPLLTSVTHRVQLGGWIQVGIALLIILYLALSQRVKDTFADFPKESESD